MKQKNDAGRLLGKQSDSLLDVICLLHVLALRDGGPAEGSAGFS